MTSRSDWEGRVGLSWAEHWQRTDRSFGALTEQLLQRTRRLTFRSVLDVGCGAGELSVALARSHGHVRVHGIDLSRDLIAAAQERGKNYQNLSFRATDAAAWRDPTFTPDLIVSRHGVMFFDDPSGAFANLLRHVAPGAELVFSCFRPRRDNHWATALDDITDRSVGPADIDEPGPFAFGDREQVEQMLLRAGWSEPLFEAVDYAMVAGMGPQAVDEARAHFLSIGPAAHAIGQLTGDDHSKAVVRLERMLQQHEVDGLVALGAAAWIVNARKPA